MLLDVLKYGHPVLRKKGARVETVTPEIKKLIADMFETMAAKHGVGLAAQQVGHALQVTVVDVREAKDRPSWLELHGKPADVNDLMPLVLVNPEISPTGEPATGAEGCLSFPEIFAEITRPESVQVKALNGKGKPIEFRCGGLLARVIQSLAELPRHFLDELPGDAPRARAARHRPFDRLLAQGLGRHA